MNRPFQFLNSPVFREVARLKLLDCIPCLIEIIDQLLYSTISLFQSVLKLRDFPHKLLVLID